jgi:putative membrane protein
MRTLCFLLLAIILAAVAVFALQNNEIITLHYLDRSVTSSLPIMIGVVYLLGMLSGWTVVGFLKRSLQRVTERRRAS